MNIKEITNEKFITTKELAEKLGTSPKVILENAKKCLQNKVIENGKPTFWNKAEITVLIEQMKTSNPNQSTFTGVVKAISTELTPALKIKKAMELMQEGYQEELAILKTKNFEQQKVIEEQKPKVEVYDYLVNKKGLYNFRDSSKILGIKEKDFMQLLKSKYIYKNKLGEYRAYAEYNQYFELRTFIKPNSNKGQYLSLNVKGLEYFKKYF